jgi:AcrR family transcriptional regulator
VRKSGQKRREEIVQAVLELAAEEGVSRMTTQAIADRVGIAQPTVFRHFRSRDLILQAAIEWIASRVLAMANAVRAESGPADARLRQLLDRQLQLIARSPGLPRLLFSERLHQDDPSLKSTVRRVMDAYTESVSGLLREGVAEGSLRADIDPDACAQLIQAMVQGLVMRWSISDFTFPLEAQGETIWQLLEPALRAR